MIKSTENKKITIIAIFDKHEDFIKLQHESIKKYIDCDYEYIVFNNASTKIQRELNQKICHELGITYIDIYVNYNGGPSDIAGAALNESFKHLTNKFVFKIDSDMFFIKKINLLELCLENDLIYIPNFSKDKEIMWSGFFGINLQKVKDSLDFRPAVIPKTDTFGQSMLLVNNPSYSKKRLELFNLQNTDNGIYTTAYNNDCLVKFKDNKIIHIEKNNYINSETLKNLIDKYKKIEKTLKIYNFPTPYNIDIITLNDIDFIIHFKSSNWCPWYTEEYVTHKKESVKMLLNNKKRIHKNIDVIIPVYNGEKFILDAVRSVVNQTYSPANIIVIDDGSTDNTNKIISEYAKTSEIPIQLVNKENGGLSSARNAGIEISNAEYIAFLDADDVWTENKLQEQMYIYEKTKFKNLALVYCNYDVIDINGEIQYKNYKAPLDKKRMRGMVFNELLKRNKITSSGSGVLIKRKVFETVGIFDKNLKFGEDWDMWLRIAKKFEVDFVEKVLVHIRKHDNNMTSNPAKTFENELQFYLKWILIIGDKNKVPLFWSDKITFRIISEFPKKNLLKIVKNDTYKKINDVLFRKTFGSFFLYIPLFFIRQILNIFIIPKYLHTYINLIKYEGK